MPRLYQSLLNFAGMLFKTHLVLSVGLGQATASVLRPLDWNCGGNGAVVWFVAPSGTSQNLNVDDIALVAAYLRYYGQSTTITPSGMLTIRATKPFECAEWSIYTNGGTIVEAHRPESKHHRTV